MMKDSLKMKSFFSKKEFLQLGDWMQNRPMLYPLSKECMDELKRLARLWIEKKSKKKRTKN